MKRKTPSLAQDRALVAALISREHPEWRPPYAPRMSTVIGLEARGLARRSPAPLRDGAMFLLTPAGAERARALVAAGHPLWTPDGWEPQTDYTRYCAEGTEREYAREGRCCYQTSYGGPNRPTFCGRPRGVGGDLYFCAEHIADAALNNRYRPERPGMLARR